VDPQARVLAVDLVSQSIQGGDLRMSFSIPGEVKRSLLEGLDAIDQTLKQRASIDAFRAADRRKRPWVYDSVERQRPAER
jgi:3-isopropylmalate/(R)-2-methylmalate dehydratase small subunit